MNYDKLTKTLRQHGVSCVRAHGRYCSICDEAATALSTLRAENEKLRVELQESEYDSVELQAELERVKKLYETEKENFIDFACSGVPNLSPYCLNRHPDCVDERGWCKTEKCHGFSRERGQKED